MNENDSLPFLREIILFLGLSGILIPTLKRFRINPVLGFLLSGVIFGPYGIGTLELKYPLLSQLSIPPSNIIDTFAQIGIIFLLFTIGLHLSFERIWNLRKWVLGAGMLQMSVTTLIIALLLSIFNWSIQNALLLGIILSFSSTAIVIQILQQQSKLNTTLGRSIFSILLLQDLMVVPLILFLETFGHTQASLWVSLLLAGAKALFAFIMIYWVGKGIIRPLFHKFADTQEPESFVALILLMALGIGTLTHFAGLSMAMGALLAGLLLAETEFRHEIEIIIKPFSGLLLGLFFFSMGMNINLPIFFSAPILYLSLAILLYALKTIAAFGVFRVFGMPFDKSAEGGILLGQASEFAFIALAIATSYQTLAEESANRLAIVMSLTLLMTPILANLSQHLKTAWRNRKILDEVYESHKTPEHPVAKIADHHKQREDWDGHVVILGYGRMGQVLGKILYQNQIPFVAIDSNAKHSAFYYEHGLPVYFGNEQHPEMLRTFNVERALCVVLTMNNREGSLKTVEIIRKTYPNLKIFARAHDEQHAQALLDTGAKEVILETLESALQLSQLILRQCDLSLDTIESVILKERAARISGIAPSLIGDKH